MSENTFKLMLKTIARKVLPLKWRYILRRYILRQFLSPQLNVSYKLLQEWPHANQSSWISSAVTSRFKKGLETFDINTARQQPDVALLNPIIQDNLGALSAIDLEEATLLDFGCGNGLYRAVLSTYARTAKWKYVGADINPEVIRFCRSLFPDTRFEVVKEGESLPFQDNEFDVILVSGVLQYVKSYVALLSELRRITRKYVLVSRLPVWKYNRSRVVLQIVHHMWGVENHPIHVFNRNEIESIFVRVGYEILLRDYGIEYFHVPGIAELAIHNIYLLQKIKLGDREQAFEYENTKNKS